MKRTSISILNLAAMAVLVGCQSLPPGAEPGPHYTMAFYINIEASEPGARIEANGEDVGSTPVRLKVFGNTDGTFHNFGSDFYVIRALTVTTNQFPQARFFRTGRHGPEDHIPQRVYFDMNHPAPSPPPAPAPYAYPGYGPWPYYGPPYYYGSPYFYGPAFRFYFGPGYYGHGHW